MDLQKASDTVSHKILLQKLLQFGIIEPTHAILENNTFIKLKATFKLYTFIAESTSITSKSLQTVQFYC